MKKLLFAALTIMLLPAMALAADYNYISQDDMRARLNAKDQMAIVDICPVDQFAQGHLPGSIETNAYPVKTDEERARLTPTVAMLKSSNKDVVIVCPGGRGGAKRTYEYYKSQGINEARMFILEKGMNGWPYQTEAK